MRPKAQKKDTPWGIAYFHFGRWLVAHKVDGRHRISWLSRLVYRAAHGPIPPGWHVHHKNRITHDDRPENLEAMSAEEHNHHHKWENCWGSFVAVDGQRVKLCKSCDRIKGVRSFYSNGFTKGSRSEAFKPTCRECQKAASKTKGMEPPATGVAMQGSNS